MGCGGCKIRPVEGMPSGQLVRSPITQTYSCDKTIACKKCLLMLERHWVHCPSCGASTDFMKRSRSNSLVVHMGDENIMTSVFEPCANIVRLRNSGRVLNIAVHNEFVALAAEKASFLASNSGKGYNQDMDKIRRKEFSRLAGFCYLDSTGAAPYPQTLVQEISTDLSASIHGNPHTTSDNAVASHTGDQINKVRERLLSFFNTDASEYTVVFTQSATAGAKLIGENFRFEHGSVLAHLETNHNSFLGIREYARDAGAQVVSIPTDSLSKFCSDPSAYVAAPRATGKTNADLPLCPSLLVYPGSCNFSGAKFPLSHSTAVQSNDSESHLWCVCLDAAALAPTSAIDLREHQPDFVCCSWYKIVGYPTGIGFVLIRNDSCKTLNKKYWGGGSVSLASPFSDGGKWRQFDNEKAHAVFEDGTLDFLSIVAMDKALRRFQETPMHCISQHVHCVTQHLYRRMSGLTHNNGNPVCKIYGQHESGGFSRQGGVVTFNLLQPDGSFFSPAGMGRVAAVNNIHVRVGIFCNPGAAAKWLCLAEKDFQTIAASGYECGKSNDFIGQKPVMAVRSSVGWMTTWEDVETLVAMVQSSFVNVSYDSLFQSWSEQMMAETLFISYKASILPGLRKLGAHTKHVATDSIAALLIDEKQSALMPAGSGRNKLCFLCCPEIACPYAAIGAQMAISRGIPAFWSVAPNAS